MNSAIRWFFVLSMLSSALVELANLDSTSVNAALVVLPLLGCAAQYRLARLRFSLDLFLIAGLAVTAGVIYLLYGMQTPAGQMRLVAYSFFAVFYAFSQLSHRAGNALFSVSQAALFAIAAYLLVVDLAKLHLFLAGLLSFGERFKGLGNPNVHGFLAACGLMLAAYLAPRQLAAPRFLRTLIALLFWLNLWAPKSRGAWLALALFSAVFFLFQPNRYKTVVCVFILALSPFLYAMRPSADSFGEAASGIRLDTNSVSGRSDVTFEALDFAVRVGYRPFGLGSTPVLKALTSMNAIDNSYLCMLLETGFAGLGVFLLFIARTLWRGLRNCLSANQNAAQLRGHRWAFAVFVSLAVHSMFESMVMSGLQLGSLLFLFCASLLNCNLSTLEREA